MISQDKGGNNMTCANNCRGVDPNAVIIGGGAVLAAAGIAGVGFVYVFLIQSIVFFFSEQFSVTSPGAWSRGW